MLEDYTRGIKVSRKHIDKWMKDYSKLDSLGKQEKYLNKINSGTLITLKNIVYLIVHILTLWSKK